MRGGLERWKRGVESRGLRQAIAYALEGTCDARVVTVQREATEATSLTEYLADIRAHASDRDLGETVLEAVRLYRIATPVNIAPLKLVSDQLGVSVSTATRMMALAREAGLAEDLITRETYNRMRADEVRRTRPYRPSESPSGPSIGL